MKNIFGRSSKNPAEVVRSLKEDLTTLEKGGDGKKQERVCNEALDLIMKETALQHIFTRH